MAAVLRTTILANGYRQVPRTFTTASSRQLQTWARSIPRAGSASSAKKPSLPLLFFIRNFNFSRPGRADLYQATISKRYNNAKIALRAITAANVAVWLTWFFVAPLSGSSDLRKALADHFTLSEANIAAGRYWTLITSAFSHQNPFHLLFNMFALNTFGTLMAANPGIGALHICTTAALSAIMGGYFQLQTWRFQHRERAYALGASGAVMGLGMAATCLVPLAPMQIMFIPVSIPLVFITLGYAFFDTYNVNNASSLVGHAAHLGGAAGGMLYYAVALRRFGGLWSMAKFMMRRR